MSSQGFFPPAGARSYRSIETSLARRSFREIIDEAVIAGRRIVITRHGRPVAALVSMRDFDEVLARDARVDELLIARRDPSDEAISLRELATNAGIRRKGASDLDRITTDEIAEEVVAQFLDETLVPGLAEETFTVVMALLAHGLGTASEVSRQDAPSIKEWLLESLRASARAREIASDD